ncbi:MAG: type II toxin-antitoxin system PemK/MazF family toxin [Kangiellaceae bacterium]|nr:type II toxin-antitoxin system PemK/MazF family toxin [Kangiellaceae bacterium]
MPEDEDKSVKAEPAPTFPSEVELLEAGYVRASFREKPDVSSLVTAAGHPFPTHEEIVQAGYVPLSRREGRLMSRPRVGQMYWVDFPHDAYAPEFEREHPGIIIRAANKLRHDTCIVLPVTSAAQKAGTHFHQLAENPNPKGRDKGIVAYVVCDHLYTVNTNRLRPLVNSRGKTVFPKVGTDDMTAIFGLLEKVLNRSFCTVTQTAKEATPRAPEVAERPEKRETQGGRPILSLNRKEG